MAAKKNRSLSARVGRWRVLFDNTQEILPEVPHIEGDLQELNGIAQEVSALRAERMVQEAKLRIITAKIRILSKKGDNIRGRIGASLKGKYGFDSFLLIQCGFTPRKKGIDREPLIPSPSPGGALTPGPSPAGGSGEPDEDT